MLEKYPVTVLYDDDGTETYTVRQFYEHTFSGDAARVTPGDATARATGGASNMCLSRHVSQLTPPPRRRRCPGICWV